MTAANPDIACCLKRVGKDRAGLDTLVVVGMADTEVSPADLWTTWTDLPRWPAWSPLHRSVTRTGTGVLAAGATFDQQISLGFPISTTSQNVTLDLLEPARRASWSGDSNGVRSCHLWSFSPLPDGRTHIDRPDLSAEVSRYLASLPGDRFPNLAAVAGEFKGTDSDQRFELLIAISLTG